MAKDQQSGATLPGDPQDPLPEPSWFWRRWFIFIVTFTLLALRYFAIASPTGQKDVTGLDWLLGLIIVCYLIAPSAEQAVKMVSMAWALRSGVQFKSCLPPTTSSGGSSGGTVEQAASSLFHPDDPAQRPRED